MKSLLVITLTLYSIDQYAAQTDQEPIQTSIEFKKEQELYRLVVNTSKDPELLNKIENFLKQRVDPNFSTLKKIRRKISILHLILTDIQDYELARNIMILFLQYGADPNVIENVRYWPSAPENITPLEFLCSQTIDHRNYNNIRPMLTREKIKFIKLLLHNGAIIPHAELKTHPLMNIALQELEAENSETRTLNALMHEVQRNTSLCDTIRQALGLDENNFKFTK